MGQVHKSYPLMTYALPRICARAGCLKDPMPGQKHCADHIPKPKTKGKLYRRKVESLVNELHSSTTVYIVECKELRAVKIGKTGNLTRRLYDLRQAVPVPLELVIAFAAPGWMEEKLHDYLASHTVKGEWFKKKGEVLAIIKLAEKGDIPGIVKKLIAAGV